MESTIDVGYVDEDGNSIIPTLTLAIASPTNITAANQGAYSVAGTCDSEGGNVLIQFSSLSVNVTCLSGTWYSGLVDVSGQSDSASFQISAYLTSALGDEVSETITTSVSKSTSTPTVTINAASGIDQSNVTAYSLTGTCSENGRVVTVSIGGISSTPNCSSGTWNTGYVNVSALADSAAINITADHDNGTISATQATTTVVKDLSLPTVTISSSPNINTSNVATYTVSGSCSENGRTVTISIGGLGFTPSCSGGTWIVSNQDVSALADGSLDITADHDNAGGTNATTATVSISKATTTPSVSSLGVAASLTNSIDLSWSLVNGSGFTINDYVINYRVQGTSIWLLFSDGTSTNTTATVTGLNASTTYEFQVKVVYDTSFESSFSTSANGTTQPDSAVFGANKAMNVGGATSSRVVAYQDATDVTLNGVALISLNKGETHTFASTQFDVIDANNPIFVAGKRGPNNGGAAGANMVWMPTAWAGKSFSFNAIRSNPQVLEVYPIESGTISVYEGTTLLASSAMTAATGLSLSWSNYGSYQVVATGTVLVFHYSNASGNYADPKPLPPSSTAIIGFPSNSMRLTTSLDGTNYTAIHSNSTSVVNNLNIADSINIGPQGGTTSLYRSESLYISADREVSGASFADSNGLCAAPFLPTSLMKTAYAVNASSDYVAFASLQAGSVTSYDSSNNVIETITLSRSGANANAPYKARFASEAAGTRYISTVPVAGWYQPNEYDGAIIRDETILYGTNLSSP